MDEKLRLVVQNDKNDKLVSQVNSLGARWAKRVPIDGLSVVESQVPWTAGLPVIGAEPVDEARYNILSFDKKDEYKRLLEVCPNVVKGHSEVMNQIFMAVWGTGEVDVDKVQTELAGALGLEVGIDAFQGIWTGLASLGTGLPNYLVSDGSGKVKKGGTIFEQFKALAESQTEEALWLPVWTDNSLTKTPSIAKKVEAFYKKWANDQSEQRTALAVQLLLSDEGLSQQFVADLRYLMIGNRGEELLIGMSPTDRKAVIAAIMGYIALFSDTMSFSTAGAGDRTAYGIMLESLGLSQAEVELLFYPLYELTVAGEGRGIGILRRSIEGKLISAELLTAEKAGGMSIFELINFLLEKATGKDFSLT